MRIADIGKRLLFGFDGTDVNEHARFAVSELGAGGVVLFTRNYESPAQLLDLCARLRELCVHPRLWIAVDQEGGRVQRFRAPFTVWPDMASFAEHGDEAAAEKFGRFCARELAAAGIDWNFAPVCDANTCAENPIIGRRSFSADPAVVARFAVAVIRGTQGAGLMACAKHFPGHGDTSLDSHKDLPVLSHDRARLDDIELPPFAAAARAGVAAMMTAHVLYAGVDPSLPATLSPKIIGLARALPFDGLIVTDDMEMAAIADRFGDDAGARAVAAGCDVLLCCRQAEKQEALIRGVFDAVMADKLPRERLLESDRRIGEAWARFPPPARPPLSEIGREEHLDLAEKMRS